MEVPGLKPTSPCIILEPVLVIVEPAMIAKFVAVFRFTKVAAVADPALLSATKREVIMTPAFCNVFICLVSIRGVRMQKRHMKIFSLLAARGRKRSSYVCIIHLPTLLVHSLRSYALSLSGESYPCYECARGLVKIAFFCHNAPVCYKSRSSLAGKATLS